MSSTGCMSPSAANRAGKLNANTGAPSALLVELRDAIRDLLLRHDMDQECLASRVAEELNRLVLELDHLRGLQYLFELWVYDGKETR